MKILPVIVFGLILLIGTASAITWSSSSGCWTATDGAYNLVMWNTSGTFSWPVPTGVTEVEYLVVGGGAGGAGDNGGGGGAGGLKNGTGLAVAGTIQVIVGAGGAGGNGARPNFGANGTASNFSTIGVNGGGGGSGHSAGVGRAGASGGGGGSVIGTPQVGGAGISGEGYAGGTGSNGGAFVGGGGGGSSEVGYDQASSSIAGNGGNGTAIYITGDVAYYAAGGGGGGGSTGNAGSGGRGGGGNGNIGAGGPGVGIGYNATFYGGGGGGGGSTSGGTGGYGYNGVVIIRYTSSIPTMNPSFTCSPLTGFPVITNISCNATTSNYIPDTYYWYWTPNGTTEANWTHGGSGVSSTPSPNVTIAIASNGVYAMRLNVTNTTVGFENFTRYNYITISDSGGATGWNRQDIIMQGIYTLTVNFQDSVSHAPIPVVHVIDSVGGNSTTSTGTYVGQYNYSAIIIYASSDGYLSTSRSYVMDDDRTTTIYLVRSSDDSEPVINLNGEPKPVQFHIQTFWGAPIPGATVSVLGITTTTGSWDWVVQLLGIPLDEVPINSTYMVNTTDSLGNLEFLLIPSAKYNVTVTAPGYTFPVTIISPHDSQYTIRANLNGTGWLETGNNTLAQVNITVTRAEINTTAGFINVTYNDLGLTTTGGTIKVYQDAVVKGENATLLVTFPVTGNSFSNSTTVIVPQGGSGYTIQVDATNTNGGIARTFATYFKGAPVQLAGLDSTILLWFSLFIVIFTAMFAGALHAPQMSIIICIESWTFWIIGWLDALPSLYGYRDVTIMLMLTFATFMAVLWNVEEGKRKGKRP